MRSSSTSFPHRAPRGFSLVEVALAVTIVSVILLAAIGLLIPSQRAIDNVLTADQSGRLRAELQKEFSLVRPGESYDSAFDKAYQILKKEGSKEGLVAAFFYRAEKPGVGDTSTLSDGRLKPFTDSVNDKREGEDYVVQATAMPLEDFEKNPDFTEALEGKLFVVRLIYLKGLLSDTSDKAFGSGSSKDFPEAVLPASAEFFVVTDLDEPSLIHDSIDKKRVKPVLSLNIGFNR